MFTHNNPTDRVQLVLDFVNSGESGRSPDALARPDETAGWLEEHVGGAQTISPPIARRLHAEALRLRGTIGHLLHTATHDEPFPPVALATLDRAVRAAPWRRRLDLSAPGLAWSEEPELSADPLSLLAPLALAAVELLSSTDPRRLRCCAAEDCGRWFIDRSKGGRRRWCSMETCGNRAKAARYRRRNKAEA